MKEIGGYMELEHFSGREYYADLIGVNSGRNALHYIIKAKKIRKLYIPYFLCDAVSNLCDDYHIAYCKYEINDSFLPAAAISLGADEWLYIVNFYGQISDDAICQMKREYGHVIVDNVMDFFRAPIPGVDTVYSCRKYFGVADGGYVSTDCLLEEPLEAQTAADRMCHLLGRYEETGSAYYSDYHRNEEYIDRMPLKAMSALSRNVMRAIDYSYVIQKRNENYLVLDKHLGVRNAVKFRMPKGPFCYPFYCECGPEIRKKLAEQKIYIPTLWPNVLVDCSQDTLEYQLAQNILPLPCDQRYEREDMLRICQAVNRLIEA